MKEEKPKEKQDTPNRMRRLWEFIIHRHYADARREPEQPKHETGGVGPEVLK